MTDWLDISDMSPRIAYTATAGQTIFPVPFVFFTNEDLVVIQDSVTLILGTDYTVSGAESPSGGSITLVSGATLGAAVLIMRVLKIVQTTHIPPSGPLDVGAINFQFSKLIAIGQQLRLLIDRAILVDPADPVPATLPNAAIRALKWMFFDGSGNPAVGALAPGTTPVSSAMAPVVAAASLSVARTALGVPALATTTVVANDRPSIRALDTSLTRSAFLAEAGREGEFLWRTGNYSALIAADPQEGVYIKADAVSATLGAWERVRTTGVYDVKWFGAKGDNTTNDAAAIQAAIDLCQSRLGGDVLFSEGGYLVNTTLTVSTPLVRLVGVGQKRSSVFTNTANIDLITVSAARCAIEKLSLFQQVQCGIASAIVTFASGAVQCTLDALDVVGGYYCFRALPGTADNFVNNCVMRLATGGAITYCQGAGTVFFKRCLFNQDWVSGGSNPPAAANDKGARANSTAYSVKDFVSHGGFYLQCTTAGTSGASPPSLTGKWYGQPITDGTAVFYLANNAQGVGALVDSACTYIQFEDCDFTGAFISGLKVANNFGTTAPDVTRVIRCTTAGFIFYGFYVLASNRLLIADCEIQSAVGNTAFNSGILIDSGVAGDVTLKGNQIVTALDYGIWLNKSPTLGSALIEGNSIFGIGKAIYVSPNVRHFQIVNNNVGSSASWGNNTAAITVAVGTSDFYIITGNRYQGSTAGVSDGGSGVNKSTGSNV